VLLEENFTKGVFMSVPAFIKEAAKDQTPTPEPQSRHEEIAVLAYSLWEARGRPDGTPEVDWLAAERELNALSAA
jgi:hypothetical protein